MLSGQRNIGKVTTHRVDAWIERAGRPTQEKTVARVRHNGAACRRRRVRKAMAATQAPCAAAETVRISVLQVRRNMTAIGGEIVHYLAMQPDVHCCRIVHVTSVAQLGCQFFAVRKA